MTARPAADDRSTRERLIDAAFAVVARDGLEGASVKLIAAEAGVPAGLLHYHFPNKDALMEAALRRALEGYRESVRARRAATEPGRQLDAFFEDARARVGPDADFFRVRLAFAAKALADPALASVMQALNAAAVEETALTFAAQRGASRPNAKDQALAATLKAAFDGLMLAHLTDPSFPLDDAGEILRRAAAAWLKD